MADHGMILKPEHVDYGDLTKFGEVLIRYDKGGSGLWVEVKGFQFADQVTCRQTCAKAVAWARDVLDAALRADVLVPGGDIRVAATGGFEDDQSDEAIGV